MPLSGLGSRLKSLQVLSYYFLATVVISEAVLFNAQRRPTSEFFFAGDDPAPGLSHVLDKRSTKKSEVSVSPMATAVHLNNSHLHLMAHWAGEGSPVVLCLGRDQVCLSGALKFFLEEAILQDITLVEL